MRESETTKNQEEENIVRGGEGKSQCVFCLAGVTVRAGPSSFPAPQFRHKEEKWKKNKTDGVAFFL